MRMCCSPCDGRRPGRLAQRQLARCLRSRSLSLHIGQAFPKGETFGRWAEVQWEVPPHPINGSQPGCHLTVLSRSLFLVTSRRDLSREKVNHPAS